MNDPNSFQFAIIGDRGGGASPLGTYERAIEQLNWLRPEFVMSVGDYVEGYTTEQAEIDEQWEEFEAIIANLQMPFFYVRGNHDINMPLTRKAWSEQRGPQYYPAIPPAILGVKKEYLDAAFDAMETKYGTIENYFSEGLGIDAAQQQALREIYLGQK